MYNNHNKSTVKQKRKNYVADFVYGTPLGLDPLVFATDRENFRITKFYAQWIKW